MKTRIVPSSALAALAALSLSAFAQTAATIATVDMELAILAHPATATNRAELQDLQTKYRAERDELLKRGDELARQYREAVDRIRDEALSAKLRKEAEANAQDRAADIRALEHEVRSLVARRRASLRKRELDLFGSVMADLKVKLDTIAKARGAAVVLDISAERATAPVPLVPWSQPSLDVTDQLIEAVGGSRADAEAARNRADSFLFGSPEDEEAATPAGGR